MVERDPQTGRFKADNGHKFESIDLLVLDEKADVGTPYADWEDDEFGEGSWRVFELPSDEDEILVIHGVTTWVSDQNELDADDPVQIWWYNGIGPVSEGDFIGKMDVPNFMAYHEFAIPPGGTVVEGRGYSPNDGIHTNFTKKFGAPMFSASGDVTICTEYLGAGGEIAWGVWYEYMEVSQEELLEELLEQANQSLTRSRP